MDKLLRDVGAEPRQIHIPPAGHSAPASPLLAVLWRRRWTLGLSILVSVAAAVAYLYSTTPIYGSTAKLAVSQHEQNVYTSNNGFSQQSETFLQTQADVATSTAVLSRALEQANYRTMKTFARATGDPISWLRENKGFKVEASKKSDVMIVSMESPYPREAMALVNNVVSSYVAEQSQDKRSNGGEMVKILNRQRDELMQKRQGSLTQMIELRKQSGVNSLREDHGNIVNERVEALNASLTAARLETINLRTQRDAVKVAIASPDAIAAYIEASQAKGRDNGDQEYQELRTQLSQYLTAQATTGTQQGPNHPVASRMQQVIDSLRVRLAAKQKVMIDAQLASLESQVAAAQNKENQIEQSIVSQQGKAMALIPQAMEYARLEADAEQYRKQADLLDARIAEINANTAEASPLNIKILEHARVEEDPIKPNKKLVIVIALLAGGVLGMGLAVMREHQDARLRSPEEILAVLGTPVLATVPRFDSRLSPVNRGQIVRLDSRSPIAEAYRSVRTSLYLGVAGKARTMLVASPMSGDGKSTTTANLAIAFAQAGDRTLLIDADLREPVQHLIFEIDGKVGLTSVMNGESKLRDAVRPTRSPGLYILPCGPVPGNPSELLGSKRFTKLIQSLSQSFDRIIIDSSPLLRFADGRILAASADATLLVLRMNQSMRTLGVVAVNGLTKVGANVVGAVANDVPTGRIYPYYGGSTQYLPESRTPVAASGVNGKNGDSLATSATIPADRTNGNGELRIDEPDWSSDPL